MRLHLAGAGRRAILIKTRVQRYGDVAGLLIIQAADGVFIIKLQRGAILQHLDADAEKRHQRADYQLGNVGISL